MIEFDRGACHGIANIDVFFPTTNDDASNAEAKRICNRCSIKMQCLALALNTAHLDGIWGGLTAAERDRLRHHPSVRKQARDA